MYNRRKGDVFWKTLNLVVNCTFLLLAITIMTLLLRNESYRTDFAAYENSLQELRREVNKVNQSNFMYLEDKANRIASNQDSYQVNTTRRLDVLEQRVQSFLENNKRVPKNNIVNTNNNIITTPSKLE